MGNISKWDAKHNRFVRDGSTKLTNHLTNLSHVDADLDPDLPDPVSDHRSGISMRVSFDVACIRRSYPTFTYSYTVQSEDEL